MAFLNNFSLLITAFLNFVIQTFLSSRLNLDHVLKPNFAASKAFSASFLFAHDNCAMELLFAGHCIVFSDPSIESINSPPTYIFSFPKSIFS